MEKIVIIPAYKPNSELINAVEELSAAELGVIVVNDGSGTEYSEIFDKVSKKAEVVNIVCNSGKGTALKTGIQTIIDKHPECKYFVTADADGQHKFKDIMRVFHELEFGADFVLTMRKFEDDMPFRSKVGNKLSKFVYTILNGHYLTDNQSGLRGFDVKNAEWLVRVEGNKYDYEMNVLYYADKQGIQLTTIPIEAVYIDNNSSSHFNPVKDTLRIYASLFYSARITFVALLIAEQLLLFASIYDGYGSIEVTIPIIGSATVVFNIVMNKFVVMRHFKYRDFMRTIIYTVLRYAGYTFGVILYKYVMPDVPLFISFNTVAIALVPAEYFVHKFLYLSKYNDIIRER